MAQWIIIGIGVLILGFYLFLARINHSWYMNLFQKSGMLANHLLSLLSFWSNKSAERSQPKSSSHVLPKKLDFTNLTAFTAYIYEIIEDL